MPGVWADEPASQLGPALLARNKLALRQQIDGLQLAHDGGREFCGLIVQIGAGSFAPKNLESDRAREQKNKLRSGKSLWH